MRRRFPWETFLVGLVIILGIGVLAVSLLFPGLTAGKCVRTLQGSALNEPQTLQAAQVQELEEFIVQLLTKEGIASSDKWFIAAHVSSTIDYNNSVLRVWRYQDGQINDENLQTFLWAMDSNQQSPELPTYVYWFSFFDVTSSYVCVDVVTRYNAGFNGGRGGNGVTLMLVKPFGQWLTISTAPYFISDWNAAHRNAAQHGM